MYSRLKMTGIESWLLYPWPKSWPNSTRRSSRADVCRNRSRCRPTSAVLSMIMVNDSPSRSLRQKPRLNRSFQLLLRRAIRRRLLRQRLPRLRLSRRAHRFPQLVPRSRRSSTRFPLQHRRRGSICKSPRWRRLRSLRFQAPRLCRTRHRLKRPLNRRPLRPKQGFRLIRTQLS